ncbi:DUF6591 domain-containing protein [Enorma massiliensis]|uniref:DUF6591 domain-containing protein n=1 Tax=Enorma massiliensis TaxID=1472761 RepID=UPI003AB7E44F
MKKRLIAVIAVLACCVAIAGCSTGAGQGSGDVPQGAASAAAEPAEDAVKVEDLDWTVASGVDGGTRRAMFSFTNNSDYAIAQVELELTFKEDATSEEIASAYDYVLEGGVTEEELRDWSMRCESNFLVEPGDDSVPDACGIGSWYVNKVEQYELMEPDMLTIVFLHDGKLYEEYYDYRSETYSMSNDTIDTTQWSDSDLASLLPQPEDELVVSTLDSDTRFSFDTICTTREGYDAYVSACSEAGFSSNVTSGDTFYYADSEDGQYHIDIMLIDSNGLMSVYVSPAEG